jgi:hypothetical protein
MSFNRVRRLAHGPRGVRRRAYVLIRQRTRRHTIFIAAPPKSGSTWLTAIVAALPGVVQLRPPEFGGRRELELTDGRLTPTHLVGRHVLDCQHVRASEQTIVQLARADARPIVLSRNIYDVLASMYDHISGIRLGEQDPSMEPGHRWSMAFLTPAQWSGLGEAERIRMLTRGFVPWYANFESSWNQWSSIVEEHDLRGMSWAPLHAPLHVRYEDLLTEPQRILTTICDAIGLSLTEGERTAALDAAGSVDTRRNQARAGRGADLLRRFPWIRDDVDVWRALDPALRRSSAFTPPDSVPTS